MPVCLSQIASHTVARKVLQNISEDLLGAQVHNWCHTKNHKSTDFLKIPNFCIFASVCPSPPLRAITSLPPYHSTRMLKRGQPLLSNTHAKRWKLLRFMGLVFLHNREKVTELENYWTVLKQAHKEMCFALLDVMILLFHDS